MREAGILLPISALNSKYGIGSFSKEAYAFVDWLKGAGQSYWQILPLGPTSFGDSPYQSFSSFAGNPYFIDLTALVEEGLIKEEDCDCDFGNNERTIDYAKIYNNRIPILKKAFNRFVKNDKYYSFVDENSYWLEDYALFMAIKEENFGKSWQYWENGYKNREKEAIKEFYSKKNDKIEFWKFVQFKFDEEWQKLRKYANKQGIKIIGDIPIYTALDSADVWANPELFELDEKKAPINVAGCPPDAFSKKGQLWGNPLYRWDIHKNTSLTRRKITNAIIRKSIVTAIKLPYVRIAAPTSVASSIVAYSPPSSATNFVAKSLPFVIRPIRGITRSLTTDVTIFWKAPPMITPTARSITLPRIAKSLNSLRNPFI